MKTAPHLNDKPAARRALAVGLWTVFLGACSLLLLHLYGFKVDTVVVGLQIKSTHMFRPALIAVLAWLGLGRLNPRLRLSRGLLLILACLALYGHTFHMPYSRDVYPSEYTALSIATGRGTSLDDYPELVKDGVPYFMTKTPKGLQTNYPLGPSLVAWPLYLPSPLSNIPRADLVHRLGITAAILIGLACVWLALQIAQKLDPPFSPYLLAFAYALGTTHWSTSASALWQHGPGELWILGALERLLDDKTPLARRLTAVGACMTLAVFTRPSLAISAALIALLTLYRYRRKSLITILSAGVVALPLVSFHLQTYGSILGAYASQQGTLSIQPLRVWLDTMFWHIASPSRGVLWYEPVVFLTLVVALFKLLRVRSVTLVTGLIGFLVIMGLYAHWPIWWGGYSFGPRLLTDTLPWWILAVASMGKVGPWLRNATVLLTLVGALVNMIGATGNPVMWDDRPSVNWFPDRLKSLGDSQLVTASITASSDLTRQAALADAYRDKEKALDLWRQEWEKRPWHRFAAFRIADLLVRTDRLEGAKAHIEVLNDRWPDSSYVKHLTLRLPRIIRLLGNPDWVKPADARASRNIGSLHNITDSLFSTVWSTERPQRVNDWLELVPEPGSLVRGVALVSAPEFGHGPEALEVYGYTPSERIILLRKIGLIKMPRKGWHVVRFDPIELGSVRVTLTHRRGHPWTVSEARLITEPNPNVQPLNQ